MVSATYVQYGTPYTNTGKNTNTTHIPVHNKVHGYDSVYPYYSLVYEVMHILRVRVSELNYHAAVTGVGLQQAHRVTVSV